MHTLMRSGSGPVLQRKTQTGPYCLESLSRGDTRQPFFPGALLGKAVTLLLWIAIATGLCAAQANTDVYTVTSPIHPVEQSYFGDINANPLPEPYKSGLLEPNKARDLLTKLNAAVDKTTIIHILRWKDKDHTKVDFQKWYLYDPTPSKLSFYLQSSEEVFQRTAIPGRKDFQFVYIHLNADLSAGTGEWATPTLDPANPALTHPISYTITVSKQQPQFVQDLQTLLQILGVGDLAVAAATPQPGYFSVSTFQSEWQTSSIQISASLASSRQPAKGSASAVATPAPVISNTYHNEKPSWIGLSAGTPVTSYKDVTYQQSSGTLVPKSITKQTAYVFLDGYLPPVLPTLSAFRWLPHPFYGLPLTGEVFRHQMFGLGIGLHWVEPFGGVIRDTQNNQVSGPNGNKNYVTWKGTFGIKISISALGKAVKK
jgi:hypothetical protein